MHLLTIPGHMHAVHTEYLRHHMGTELRCLCTHLPFIPRHGMPCSHDVFVPDIVEGIEEVVIKHTRTKCGTIRTTEKVVPVVRPQKEKSGQPSRSHKKNTQPQVQAETAEVSGRSIPTHGDLQIGLYTDEQYMDEQQYSLHDAEEYGQPQATRRAPVCFTFHLHHDHVAILIRYRLQCDSGLNSGIDISMFYWRWKARDDLTSVPCATRHLN